LGLFFRSFSEIESNLRTGEVPGTGDTGREHKSGGGGGGRGDVSEIGMQLVAFFFFFYRGLWAFSFTVLFSSPKKLIVQFTYISRDKSFLKEKKQKVQIKFKNQHESHSITFVF